MARKKMQPAEFTAIREQLGFSKAALARQVGVDRKTIVLIEGGANRRGIPTPLAKLMIAYRDGHRARGEKFPCDKVQNDVRSKD